jgi:prolyl-tRNA synthetase
MAAAGDDAEARRASLFEFLKASAQVDGLDEKTFAHDPVETVDAWRAALGKRESEFQLCKNLFLWDKKGKQLHLLVALAETQASLAVLTTACGFNKNSNPLRFAPEEDLWSSMQLKKGGVSPLGLFHDKADHKVTVLLDSKMNVGSFDDEEEGGKEDLTMLFHPLTNDRSTPMTSSELRRFLKACGHEFKSLDLAALAEAQKAQAAQPKKGGAKPKRQQPKKGERRQQAKAERDATGKNTRSALLGMTVRKDENFSEWYSQVVIKTELIDYYDISGCYILRPDAYEMWEHVKDFLDGSIKKLGVRNCQFPMFISKAALCKEEDHVEGFAPEVAWVTKGGSSEMDEPIAVRPTSETAMYPAYAKWIRSHRDLPLKLNQWVSVVRWEFKSPTPFLRSREFLWQEGHTVFASKAEAMAEVFDILDIYAAVYEDVLAVPVVKGRKTEEEKFPGGEVTTTVECFIDQSGRAIQAATSHCLGQNFAKMYEVMFENDQGQRQYAWQNSWGLTTRSLGVMIMVHGDDKGLVLPPRVAPTQVVFVPLAFKGKDNDAAVSKAKELAAEMQSSGIRALVDTSVGHNPGFRFHHWELRGIPVRIEIGPRDLEGNTCDCVRRDTGEKTTLAMDGSLASGVAGLLAQIQAGLFAKAKRTRDAAIETVTDWADFVPSLNRKKLVLSPWCEVQACELAIKDRSGDEAADVVESMDKATQDANDSGKEAFVQLTGAAKSLCMPLDQPALPAGTRCVGCGQEATVWCLFGRSY